MDNELAAWALRNARFHAPVPMHRQQTHVASALLGYGQVHRAQIGRWESGEVAVTYERVRRYEDLLGYQQGTIQCQIDVLHRAKQPIRSEPLLAPHEPVDVRDVIARLEVALSDAPMTGLDWYCLSSDLGRNPSAILRGRDWRALFERCLLELAVTLDLEYALREEALARLAGHPQSGSVIASMARETLLDANAQVYNDTATLLMHCSHRDATDLLVRTLVAPVNNDALRAALLALSSIMRGAATNGTAPALVSAVAGHALGFVRDDSRPLRVRRQAANLLRALDLPSTRQLAYGLHHSDMKYAATILLEGRALERKRLHALRARVREALEGSGSLSTDPILGGLVQTALEDTDDLARSFAVRVLMLVPQRPVIASTVARELSVYRADEDWVGVHECLELLVPLAQANDLDEVTELLVAAATAPEVALLCGIVVGNAPDPDRARASRRLAAVARRASDVIGGVAEREVRASAANAPRPSSGLGDTEGVRQQLRGLIYALGIKGQFEVIADLRERAFRASAGTSSGDSTADRCRDGVNGHALTGERTAADRRAVAIVAMGICDWWLEMPNHIKRVCCTNG